MVIWFASDQTITHSRQLLNLAHFPWFPAKLKQRISFSQLTALKVDAVFVRQKLKAEQHPHPHHLGGSDYVQSHETRSGINLQINSFGFALIPLPWLSKAKGRTSTIVSYLAFYSNKWTKSKQHILIPIKFDKDAMYYW